MAVLRFVPREDDIFLVSISGFSSSLDSCTEMAEGLLCTTSDTLGDIFSINGGYVAPPKSADAKTCPNDYPSVEVSELFLILLR